MTASNICADVAKRKCDFYIRCKSDTADNQGRTNDQVAASERARCEAFHSSDRGCLIGAAGWDAGRAVVDQAKYLSCVDTTYPTNSCTRDPNLVFERCKTSAFFVANTPPGGLCTDDAECKGGFCNVAQNATCGTCQAWLNADGGTQNCNRDSQCDPSRSYCLGNDGNNSNNPCLPFKDAGVTCMGNNQTVLQQAIAQEECGPGQVCAGPYNFNGARACAKGKAEGAACVKNNFECGRTAGRFDLVCASRDAGDVCVKQYNSDAGQPCGGGEIVNFGNQVTLGGGSFCLETEFCQTGVCNPRRAQGQPCNTTDQCAGGLRCAQDPQSGTTTCLSFQDLGQACGNSTFCKNQLGCDAGTCKPTLAAVGEPCTTGNGNNPGNCADGFCTGVADGGVPRCKALLPQGSSCGQSAQCDTYSCVGAVCAAACWK